MGLVIQRYKGPIDNISPDEMWGDGFRTEDGWVAVVGSAETELERRSGYRTEYMSSVGMESIWQAWKKKLNQTTIDEEIDN